MSAKLLTLITALVCSSVFAQSGTAFPDQPVRIVVPFTPGGNVDIVARIVGQALSEELKQRVLVENRPGASGAIGADYVSRQDPNGYTLLVGTAETHALNPHINAALQYDPLKDLQAIGIIDRFSLSLVVSPKLPVDSLADFIAYAKKRPGELNFASWGSGSTGQIAFEQLKQLTGIDMLHVPYKGAAPAITAVAAGDVHALMVPLSVAQPQASSGRVKLLMVTTAEREAAAPDVPTATEQGVPVVISLWHILAAPSGTPQAVLARLNNALNAVTARPDVRAKLADVGVKATTSTMEEAQKLVRDEWQTWGDVAKKAGLTPK